MLQPKIALKCTQKKLFSLPHNKFKIVTGMQQKLNQEFI